MLVRGLAATVGALLIGCGAGPPGPSPPWRAEHPDTANLSFLDQSAAGLCALTVRYPDEAPAIITFNGGEYVQTGRSSRPSHPSGLPVDHSGDWSIVQQPDQTLLLLTPELGFTYRSGRHC